MKSLLCLLFACAAIAAQADNSVQLGQIVVTDTGAPTPLQILPGNTALVNAQALELIGETHPAQIFYNVPGAWVTEGSGQESLVSIRSPLLTGSGACGAFLFLEDSVPIQPAGFCDVNSLFEINTEQAQAVEVVRGSGSVLYGSNALNGIVNVLTRGPDYQPANSAAWNAAPMTTPALRSAPATGTAPTDSASVPMPRMTAVSAPIPVTTSKSSRCVWITIPVRSAAKPWWKPPTSTSKRRVTFTAWMPTKTQRCAIPIPQPVHSAIRKTCVCCRNGG